MPRAAFACQPKGELTTAQPAQDMLVADPGKEADFSFPKQNRLLNASDYKRVFDRSEHKVSTRFFLILARNNEENLARLGLIVAKKNSKRAVDRNRLKRLIRDRFRHHKARLGGLDAIVLTRRGTDTLNNKQLIHQLDRLWLDLINKLQHSSNRH